MFRPVGQIGGRYISIMQQKKTIKFILVHFHSDPEFGGTGRAQGRNLKRAKFTKGPRS